MKVIFFGTPDFAAVCLAKIIESKHQVEAVVTGEDKQRGRGRKVTFTPVKELALQKNLPLLQPKILRDKKFIEQLKIIDADIFVVVAFKILPECIFSIPPKGTFNLHGSLLPKYRGAAPIQWALINGEKETGLTTFFIQKQVDSGNIILQKTINIESEDNFGSLHDKMAEQGGELIVETLNIIEAGNLLLKKQDEYFVSLAPKIESSICHIDFEQNSEKVHNLVRGLSPYPGAYFKNAEKIYKVLKTKILSTIEYKKVLIQRQIDLPKRIKIFLTKKNIYVKTVDGYIEILEIQPEGKRRMTAEEFLRGNKF